MLFYFVGFGNNVDVHFAYYGHRCFEILSFTYVDFTTNLRPFHSRSTHNRCTIFFDIKLTEDMFPKTELVESLYI
jgi:hypothetical protein